MWVYQLDYWTIGSWLVGGFNHLEKYEFVNGKDDIPYMKWKIKVMFQTTSQLYNYIYIPPVIIHLSRIFHVFLKPLTMINQNLAIGSWDN